MKNYSDSIDKIVETYFRVFTKTDFTYKTKTIKKLDRIRFSPDIFRNVKCFKDCGACCRKFSMDWLPYEMTDAHTEFTNERLIKLNGKDFIIHSYLQEGNEGYHCGFVDLETGWCKIHNIHGFSCDFELIRCAISEKNSSANVITRLYGRGWNMLKIDGVRGAMCEVDNDITQDSINDTIRKLERLKVWIDYFNIDSYIDDVLKWAKNKDIRKTPLIINNGLQTTINNIF